MEISQNSQANSESHRSHELGGIIGHYPTRRQSRNRWFGTAAGGLIVLTLLILFAFKMAETIMAVRVHGRAMVLPQTPSLMLLLFGISLGGIILLLTVVHWNNHLTLYDRGIVMQRGLKKRIWYWETTTRLDTRITHIKFGGSIVDVRIKLILGNDHKKLMIRNRYEDMPDLIQKMRSTLLPVLADWAIEQIKQQKPIEFHKRLSATSEGLKLNGDQIMWKRVESPEIKNQKFILYDETEHEKLFQANLNKITNLDLLIFLLENPLVLLGQSSSR